jgi:hypothetical protein
MKNIYQERLKVQLTYQPIMKDMQPASSFEHGRFVSVNNGAWTGEM